MLGDVLDVVPGRDAAQHFDPRLAVEEDPSGGDSRARGRQRRPPRPRVRAPERLRRCWMASSSSWVAGDTTRHRTPSRRSTSRLCTIRPRTVDAARPDAKPPGRHRGQSGAAERSSADRGGRGQCAGQQPAVCTIDESQRASRRDGHLSVRRGVTPYQVTYSAPVPIPEQRSVDSSYMPATGTGVGRSVVVPSPSWPVSFFPQQYARSAVVTAQAPQISADTSRNGSPPATFTGSTL
jgi:hypothetical protein